MEAKPAWDYHQISYLFRHAFLATLAVGYFASFSQVIVTMTLDWPTVRLHVR